MCVTSGRGKEPVSGSACRVLPSVQCPREELLPWESWESWSEGEAEQSCSRRLGVCRQERETFVAASQFKLAVFCFRNIPSQPDSSAGTAEDI